MQPQDIFTIDQFCETTGISRAHLYSDISDPKNQTLTNAVRADLGPPFSLSEAEASDDCDDELDECAVG